MEDVTNLSGTILFLSADVWVLRKIGKVEEDEAVNQYRKQEK